MPRYIQQLHDYSCAVAAVLNVGKWAGYKLTIKNDYKNIFNKIGCKQDGTSIKNIDNFLRENFKTIKITKKRIPSFLETKNHIINNGPVLISFSWQDNLSADGISVHIGLFTEIINNYWTGHNVCDKEKTSHISEKEIKDYFYKMPTTPWSPKIWLLKKKIYA